MYMNPLRVPVTDTLRSLTVCDHRQLMGTISDALQSVGSIKHYVIYTNTTTKLDPYLDRVATVYVTRINAHYYMVLVTIHDKDYSRYDKANKKVSRESLTRMLYDALLRYRDAGN